MPWHFMTYLWLPRPPLNQISVDLSWITVGLQGSAQIPIAYIPFVVLGQCNLRFHFPYVDPMR